MLYFSPGDTILDRVYLYSPTTGQLADADSGINPGGVSNPYLQMYADDVAIACVNTITHIMSGIPFGITTGAYDIAATIAAGRTVGETIRLELIAKVESVLQVLKLVNERLVKSNFAQAINAPVISASTPPWITVVTNPVVRAVNGVGTLSVGEKLYLKPVAVKGATGGAVHNRKWFAVTDSNGVAQFVNVVKGYTYRLSDGNGNAVAENDELITIGLTQTDPYTMSGQLLND